MDLNIGDKVFYTKSTGLRVPAKVVGHSDEGYVELEYHQDGVRAVNHHCPMDALSFGILSWDSPPPSPSSLPADPIPGDASGGSPLRGHSPLRTSSPSPSRSHAPSRCASPAPPGLLWEDEGEDEEVRPTKRALQTSGKTRARDKEVRELVKTLPVQLKNEYALCTPFMTMARVVVSSGG